MNTSERYIARVLFQREVYASDGNAYEAVFTKVMGYADPDFIQVKPQGTLGDRKNDGYNRRIGHYFQVYAPENPADESKRAHAATKASTDFAGLADYWQETCPIKAYSFAFNDKYKGTFPEIETALAAIKKEHGLPVCDCFLAKHLEDILFSLPDDKILMVVGSIPDPDDIQSLDYSLLNEVIAAVHELQSAITPQTAYNAPDFGEKIKFNGLSERVGALLHVANFQTGAVDNFFSRNSSFAKQSLRDEINRIYLECKAAAVEEPERGVSRGDLIFFDLLRRITPRVEKPIQDAALVIIAYYFESCDVFDDPSGTAK